MSTLSKQVAQPQTESIPKTRGRVSTGPICKCGRRKEHRSVMCRKCVISANRSPVPLETIIFEGRVCRYIALTRGQKTLVDESVYERIMTVPWRAQWSEGMQSYYAVTKIKGRWISMPAFIFGVDDGRFFDHKNGDTLCNVMSNLREATPSQNSMNKKRTSHNRSGYIGVTLIPKGRNRSRTDKWFAHIRVQGKLLSLGCFASPEAAARARDAAAIKYFGEFARLNFPR